MTNPTIILSPSPTTRVVAVMGGGDWADASVDHLSISVDLNLDNAHADYEYWLREVYHRQFITTTYRTFVEWLKETYSVEDADVEEYWGNT